MNRLLLSLLVLFPYLPVAPAMAEGVRVYGSGSAGITSLTGDVTGSGSGAVATTIANGVVDSNKLAVGAVDSGKLGLNSVTKSSIQTGVIDSFKIATDAVTTAAILAGAVNTSKLATDSVTTVAIKAGSVDSGKIVSGVVLTAPTFNSGALANGTLPLKVSGGTSVNTAIIAMGADTTADAGIRFSYGGSTELDIDVGYNGAAAAVKVRFGTDTTTTTALAITALGDVTVTNTLTQGIVKSCSLGLTTTSTGAITGCVTSDSRMKHDVLSLSYDPKAIDSLRPITYEWNDKERGEGKHAGFIAQEVQKVIPLAVVKNGVGDDPLLGVDPNGVLAAIVLEVQALRKRVSALEKVKK